jgi:hypothetical protein
MDMPRQRRFSDGLHPLNALGQKLLVAVDYAVQLVQERGRLFRRLGQGSADRWGVQQMARVAIRNRVIRPAPGVCATKAPVG